MLLVSPSAAALPPPPPPSPGPESLFPPEFFDQPESLMPMRLADDDDGCPSMVDEEESLSPVPIGPRNGPGRPCIYDDDEHKAARAAYKARTVRQMRGEKRKPGRPSMNPERAEERMVDEFEADLGPNAEERLTQVLLCNAGKKRFRVANHLQNGMLVADNLRETLSMMRAPRGSAKRGQSFHAGPLATLVSLDVDRDFLRESLGMSESQAKDAKRRRNRKGKDTLHVAQISDLVNQQSVRRVVRVKLGAKEVDLIVEHFKGCTITLSGAKTECFCVIWDRTEVYEDYRKHYPSIVKQLGDAGLIPDGDTTQLQRDWQAIKRLGVDGVSVRPWRPELKAADLEAEVSPLCVSFSFRHVQLELDGIGEQMDLSDLIEDDDDDDLPLSLLQGDDVSDNEEAEIPSVSVYECVPRSYAAYWKAVAKAKLNIRFNYTPYRCEVSLSLPVKSIPAFRRASRTTNSRSNCRQSSVNSKLVSIPRNVMTSIGRFDSFRPSVRSLISIERSSPGRGTSSSLRKTSFPIGNDLDWKTKKIFRKTIGESFIMENLQDKEGMARHCVSRLRQRLRCQLDQDLQLGLDCRLERKRTSSQTLHRQRLQR